MRPASNPGGETRRIGLPLSVKLALALVAVAAALLAFLLFWFGPYTTQTFLARSNEIVGRSAEAMRTMARANASNSKEVLVSLIQHTTDSRMRTLQDLPLSLYAGDVPAMRDAIVAEDRERGARLERNAGLLGREIERRSMHSIDEHVAGLTREESVLAARFASDVRRAYLVLCGGVLGLLLAVLGVGLYRIVVRPVRSLREATLAVTQGDLAVSVDVTSRDEVGALSAGFQSMVEQLRTSRSALETLNRDLEAEVARKSERLRRAERRLAHAEKMASLGTLAGGIAHEFNNLLGGIRGCANEMIAEETVPDRRETLAVILRATERGADVTNRLLGFARPRVAQMADVDTARALSDALRLVEPEARRRGVTIDARCRGPLSAWADSGALHQVFLNLLTNALQAMPGGGRLTVEATARTEELEFRFTDTGVGIPEHAIARVFEPFFTSKDAETDPAQRGTGLGLSVSYGIVEAHGGTLEVESRPGATVFTVRLPRHRNPEEGRNHG